MKLDGIDENEPLCGKERFLSSDELVTGIVSRLDTNSAQTNSNIKRMGPQRYIIQNNKTADELEKSSFRTKRVPPVIVRLESK